MTDKELHKLKRQELLEILYYMRTELDDVRAENDRLKQRLETRDKDYEHIMEGVKDLSAKLNSVCAKVGVPVNEKPSVAQKSPSSKNRRNRRKQNSGQQN